MTHILVINSGSSSLKYRLLSIGDGGDGGGDGQGTAVRLASGLVERIGEPGSPVADHGAALDAVSAELASAGFGIDSPELTAIGHRVVHGGRDFTEPTLITDEVAERIERLIPLAPLHNPANLAGIEVARRIRPDLPQVAVFDTAFHCTVPAAAATYAIDRETAERYGIRRYGFHGTSHAYVSRAAAGLADRPGPGGPNVIVLHLGNGASASAVAGGRCVETSMGLTPLEGLVMGTRSGDVDPGVLMHLRREAGMEVERIDELLNRRSGLLGLCGDNDMRAVEKRVAAGDPEAELAHAVYCHRLRKYVGAYYAVLGTVDVIAFTGGIGENSSLVRARALSGLEALGIVLDDGLNAAGEGVISAGGSRVKVAVVPTDEELEIARQTLDVISRTDRG
ncbi:acetate kinase [Planomonospora parontospora subsp. parontospora]|uniref:Acetate kinase n=2 Tax=Planomonospora parontospora TaxID=58119 RepID=A0AA37F2G2_9ACTN|nr:acetate kinase [Planomonospora parontospora]GGK51496.1 acetate kinase [Planomonospora parontospora]GII06989.1 acetate kinase [Planomonospora parontospora subsp. parontospora]